jgi:hypothetical protein
MDIVVPKLPRYNVDHLRPKLHVLTMISNVMMYDSRYDLYEKFKQHMAALGVNLITIELAYGDRAFEVTEKNNPNHVQLRTWHEIWHKENALNVGLAYLSQVHPDWEFVGWFDADIEFIDGPIAIERALHALQRYMIIQPWSTAFDKGPEDNNGGGNIIGTHRSFMYSYKKNLKFDKTYAGWHPGFAWMARREAIENLRLIDIGILGAGDRHFACSSVGRMEDSIVDGLHPEYAAELMHWQERAMPQIQMNVGYVNQTIGHGWHGNKHCRGYATRWEILKKRQYRPRKHLYTDVQGLYGLQPSEWQLRDDISRYFESRNEDSNEFLDPLYQKVFPKVTLESMKTKKPAPKKK